MVQKYFGMSIEKVVTEKKTLNDVRFKIIRFSKQN